MKMTSGKRLQDRRRRALARLEAQPDCPISVPAAERTQGQHEYVGQWQARREAEIATLRKLLWL